jgi:hypothetical protein
MFFPLLRREIVSQGQRKLVAVGDKLVDYN